jgi:acylphosphatase
MMKKRLTAYVAGTVQKVGYRARVMDFAKMLGLRGTVENLDDGRIKIVAEGDEEKLKWFEEAIVIKNTLIKVSAIEKEYSEPKGEVSKFYKLVEKGETDSRIDAAAFHLKDLIAAVDRMNGNLGGKMDVMIKGQEDLSSNLGGKMDVMIKGQEDLSSNLGGKMDVMIKGQEDLSSNLGGKMDVMIKGQEDLSSNLGGKMDVMIDLQKETLNAEEDLLEEVQESRKDLKGYLEQRFEKLESEVTEMRSALIAKGII